MGLFDSILNNNENQNTAQKPKENESVTFSFVRLPESLEELKALPEAKMDTPYKTAALSLVPFTVTIFSNPYSFQNENYATLHLRSGGADNPRQFRLRLKPSTGVWYLDEQMILVGIRPAQKDDPWS